jgi:hypothetical protein
MKAVTIQPRSFIPEGKVFVMADTSHPEVDLWTTIDEADALIIACHPEQEQAVRDLVAVEQERPKWWRDMRRFEATIGIDLGRFDNPFGRGAA